MRGILGAVNLAKAAYKATTSRVKNNARARASTSDSKVSNGPVIGGQRRANAIDSIVDVAQRGGDERQSSYPKR